MGRIAGWLLAAALGGITLSGTAVAQSVNAAQVRSAADKFAGNVMWRPGSVLEADFNCSGKVQYAILGTSANEIVVAIFNQDLTLAPALLRFEADARNATASKIRLDDYSMTAAEIAGVSGADPVGYRPSAACHGVRLSDDSHEAAHIYWDHDNRRFESWAQ